LCYKHVTYASLVIVQGNNTAFGENLTSTVDDSLSPWGFTRGESQASAG
jgi:hypothetical protein